MAEPMPAAAFRFETYDAPRGPEWMLIHGRAAPRAMILPPLLGEGNSTRALIADVARRLAAAGIGSAIPDLPGTGESVHPVEAIGWEDWRSAAAAAANAVAAMGGTPPHLIALRGGALLDDGCAACSWWRFAPTPGAALLRQLERAQAIGDRESGRAAAEPAVAYVELAGYRLGASLRDALRVATPAEPEGPLRSRPFDGPGIAPWRRAEPAGDAALAATLAADIAEWIRSCDA